MDKKARFGSAAGGISLQQHLLLELNLGSYMQHGNHRPVSNVIKASVVMLKISQIRKLIYFQKLKQLVYIVTYTCTL